MNASWVLSPNHGTKKLKIKTINVQDVGWNKTLLWKYENNITQLWCKLIPKFILNKIKVIWKELHLFIQYWGFSSRKNISQYFKLTQINSKYLKRQNIYQYFKIFQRTFLGTFLITLWMNFIHHDVEQDVNHDVRGCHLWHNHIEKTWLALSKLPM